MSDFKVESYTNEFGQTINPGDDVIYAGTSYKSTTLRAAKFAGVYYDNVRKSVHRVNENGDPVLNERGYRIWDTVSNYEPVAVKVTDVIDRFYHYEEKKYVEGVRPRPAILPYMRVYKLHTPLTQLVGKTL